MCGRFTFGIDVNDIKLEFDLKQTLKEYKPNYNAAPSQKVPVIISDGKQNSLQMYRWGLIPFWAKDSKIRYKLINARAESVSEKPSYKKSLQYNRCLVVADGFYEWKKTNKMPVYIKVKDRKIFGFAGLWDQWSTPKGEIINSCTIITTEPNSFMKKIHDRMPVIVEKKQESRWLDPTLNDPKEIQGILHPYSGEMNAYEVSTLVNYPKNNSEECIKPIGH